MKRTICFSHLKFVPFSFWLELEPWYTQKPNLIGKQLNGFYLEKRFFSNWCEVEGCAGLKNTLIFSEYFCHRFSISEIKTRIYTLQFGFFRKFQKSFRISSKCKEVLFESYLSSICLISCFYFYFYFSIWDFTNGKYFYQFWMRAISCHSFAPYTSADVINGTKSQIKIYSYEKRDRIK